MKRPLIGKRTRWIIVGILAVVGALLVVTVFGQDIRHLMGAGVGCP